MSTDKSTSLFVLLVIIAIAITQFNKVPEDKQMTDKEFFMQLVKTHPDPAVSQNMASKWQDGKIIVRPTNSLGLSALGSMDFIPHADFKKEYGYETPYPVQPVMLINANLLATARSDDHVRCKLMKTVRHELEHFLQWERGEFFQTRPEDVTCKEIWEREFPIYLDDCHRTARWWPDQPSVFPDDRCSFANNPARFARIIHGMLGQRIPKCTSEWSDIIASMSE